MVTTWCWKGSSPLFKTMAFRYKTRLSFSLPIIVVNLRKFVSSKNPRPYLTSENRNDKMLRFTLHVSRLNGIVLSFVNSILVFLWSWRCAKKIHVQLQQVTLQSLNIKVFETCIFSAHWYSTFLWKITFSFSKEEDFVWKRIPSLKIFHSTAFLQFRKEQSRQKILTV